MTECLLGLAISFVVFVVLTVRGWSIVLSSVAAGCLVALTNGIPLWVAFRESFSHGVTTFSQGFSSFAGAWWLVFVLGAVFGKCMQDTGLSRSMARIVYQLFRGNAILAVFAISFVLSYGGIGTFIIAFTVYPIASDLFKHAKLSRHLLPATILFCPTTVCMTMLPGTPSVQNMIPTTFLGTTIYAAPLYGLLASLVTVVLGYLYLHFASKKLSDSEVENRLIPNTMQVAEPISKSDYLAFVPCVALWGVAFAMIHLGNENQFSIAVAMFVAIVLCVIIKYNQFNYKNTINVGIEQGMKTLAMTSCIMGYGALVQSTVGFASCTHYLTKLGAPLFSSVLAINVIAAITGSSTASLQLFYEFFSSQITSIPLSAECIHRVSAIASGCLDSMPYATGVVVANDMAKSNLKDTYLHIFVTCAVIPFVALLVVLLVMC